MKQKIQKFLAKPKTAILSFLALAIVIGAAVSIIQTKSLESKFAQSPVTLDTPKANTSGQDLTLAFPVGGRIKSVSVKIGDTVKAGTVLASLDSENALGAVNQARGAYTSAQTAYDKLVNGANDTDIKIAKVALDNAKTNYTNVVATQKTLVSNALSAMYNNGLAAIPTSDTSTTIISPVITGLYNGTDEGTYTITVYSTGNGNYFTVSGLETSSGPTSTLAVPLGTHGLFIQFPPNFTLASNNVWTVDIPNTKSANYVTYYNAYQSALQTQTQAVAGAQGAVDAAQANLDQKVAGARSEDLAIAKAQVDSTKGALQIAEGNYNNTIITAPVDGKITNVSITAGQIATPNAPAIEILSN